MIRVASIDIPINSPDFNQEQVIDIVHSQQMDIICWHGIACGRDNSQSTVESLAETLAMTCSFSATKPRRQTDGKNRKTSPAGLAILTGPATWMMYSGNVPLTKASGQQDGMAQFAIIRKNGDALLIINLNLDLDLTLNGQQAQQRQLETLFSHPIMAKQFAAIIISTASGAAPQRKKVLHLLKKSAPFGVRNGLVGRLFRQQAAPDCGGLYILAARQNPVAKISIRNSRFLHTTDLPSTNHSPQATGVALDLGLSRIHRDETSQLYRCASFTPRPGTVTMQGPQNVFF